MNTGRFNFFSACLFLLFVISGCKEKKKVDDGGNDTRTLLLINYADNLIKPAYNNTLTKTELLKQKAETFTANPDNNTLTDLQAAWVDAFTAFQHVNAYNFGPAAEDGLYKSLVEETATFPVNVTATEGFINAGDTSFANFARDTRGFLTVEYLIYGTTGNTEVINSFASVKRKDYLMAAVNRLLLQINTVNTNWGLYRSVFINNNGTDAGSSISSLYNEWLKSYEILKNYKLGLPCGIRTGQTQPEPDKVECYYSKLSVKMIKEHFASTIAIWRGEKMSGGDGLGLQDYLLTCVGGSELNTATLTQIQAVQSALDNIPDNASLAQLIANNDPALTTLNTELQKLTRFIKSDMSSIMGISITYSSGDGD